MNFSLKSEFAIFNQTRVLRVLGETVFRTKLSDKSSGKEQS